MELIQDEDLRRRIAAGRLICGVADPIGQVKPCSVDFTIGEIYVPGAVEVPGSVAFPRRELSLGQGETAVIRTREMLQLGRDQAGIAFPPASESLKGLLMTNPGHVDPGFVGYLHVTVINFGKEAFPLTRGGRLLRVLIFELSGEVRRGYENRLHNPIDQELLGRLSPDFLDFKQRARTEAEQAVVRVERRYRLWQLVVPIAAAIVAALLSWLASFRAVEDRLLHLETRVPQDVVERLSRNEAMVPLVTRLDALEMNSLRLIDERLRRLEESLNRP